MGANYCENCGISLTEFSPLMMDKTGSATGSGRGMERGTRNALIVIFVAIDLLIAGFLIYYLTQIQ